MVWAKLQKVNIAQVKKMNMDGVRHFRDQFNVPVADEQIEKLPYITFEKDSEEYKYLHERRQALGGYLPARRSTFDEKLISLHWQISANYWKSNLKKFQQLSRSFVR